MGLHGAAAAIAAVADRIESAEHRILEERVVDVPAFVLSPQYLHRFCCRNASGFRWMVLKHEARKRLADDQADIERKTRRRPRSPARALQKRDVVRIGEDDVLGEGIGDDPFEVPYIDRPVHRHKLGGGVERNNLAVVRVRKAGPGRCPILFTCSRRMIKPSLYPVGKPPKAPGKGVLTDAEADIEVGPS